MRNHLSSTRIKPDMLVIVDRLVHSEDPMTCHSELLLMAFGTSDHPDDLRSHIVPGTPIRVLEVDHATGWASCTFITHLGESHTFPLDLSRVLLLPCSEEYAWSFCFQAA